MELEIHRKHDFFQFLSSLCEINRVFYLFFRVYHGGNFFGMYSDIFFSERFSHSRKCGKVQILALRQARWELISIEKSYFFGISEIHKFRWRVISPIEIPFKNALIFVFSQCSEANVIH